MNNVRKFRIWSEMTRTQLAENANIAPSTLSDIELERHVPNVYIAINLSRALGIDVETLFPPDEYNNFRNASRK